MAIARLAESWQRRGCSHGHDDSGCEDSSGDDVGNASNQDKLIAHVVTDHIDESNDHHNHQSKTHNDIAWVIIG